MMDNHPYNVLNQLAQESKSLWRIKNNYMKDAKDCKNCSTTWEKIAEEKQKCINVLEKQLKDHM